MQHFIYITTNLVNSKYYIGFHNTDNEDLDPGYLGSGNNLKLAKRKYGKENFRRDIICFASNELTLGDLEAYLVNAETVKDPLCYNIAFGGHGGNRGPEVNAKISASNTGKTASPETKAKMSATRTGKPGPNKGKTLSAAWRANIGLGGYGRLHSPATKAKMSATRKAYYAKRREEMNVTK
jgi:group I intron endonuclease